MKVLLPEQVEEKLANLNLEWSVISGVELQRSFSFKNFVEALQFVNAVGKISEELDHHPNIFINYGRVDLTLTTHSSGGLTQKDFDLAQKIQKI